MGVSSSISALNSLPGKAERLSNYPPGNKINTQVPEQQFLKLLNSFFARTSSSYFSLREVYEARLNRARSVVSRLFYGVHEA